MYKVFNHTKPYNYYKDLKYYFPLLLFSLITRALKFSNIYEINKNFKIFAYFDIFVQSKVEV